MWLGFGSVQKGEEGNLQKEGEEKQRKRTITSTFCSLLHIIIVQSSINIISLAGWFTPYTVETWMWGSVNHIWSWHSERTDGERVAEKRHNPNPFFNFPYSLDSWSIKKKGKGSTSVSYKRFQRLGEVGWLRVSVWERQRRGREMLEATGYLSRYNGVSYEKTSVNFLSDLQQSITQSSHSADLWSCCLTESCHCSQPPTHRNSNFGLTNFPCNAIQLSLPAPLFRAYEVGDLWILKSK